MAKLIRAPELVERALRIGLINKAQAEKYLENYDFFRQQEPILDALYDGKWVASVNKRIYTATTDAELHKAISKEPEWQRAYIRYMGGLI